MLVILLEVAAVFLASGATSDFTWLGLAVTAGFVWAVAELFRLSAPVLALILLGVVLDAVSAPLELYSRIEPWDLLIHALGGAIIAVAALEFAARALKKGYIVVRRRGYLIFAFTYLSVVAVGFLYELLEYLVDKLQYGYPKSLVSAYDSIEDQVFNILGATLVLAIYYYRSRRRGADGEGL